jgi:DNA-binding MarR family transcriptional regulator
MTWRHDNTGRLLFDSTRRFQERVLALVNDKGYSDIRIAHLAVTRHIDLAGTRIADVAARAGVTKQSMSEMIEQLRKMGFVRLDADASDKRAKIVTFTESGRALLDAIRKAVATTERELASRIGARQVAALRTALGAYCRVADGPASKQTAKPRARPRQF